MFFSSVVFFIWFFHLVVSSGFFHLQMLLMFPETGVANVTQPHSTARDLAVQLPNFWQL
jgi:hypothetical protein